MCVLRPTRIHQRIQMSQMNPISSFRMKLHDPLSGLFAQTPAAVRVEKQGDDCVGDIGSRGPYTHAGLFIYQSPGTPDIRRDRGHTGCHRLKQHLGRIVVRRCSDTKTLAWARIGARSSTNPVVVTSVNRPRATPCRTNSLSGPSPKMKNRASGITC